MAGGSLSPAPPLLAQELLEPVGGEGERLAAQLHQVGILQPRVGEAVLQGGPAPARPGPITGSEPGQDSSPIQPGLQAPSLDPAPTTVCVTLGNWGSQVWATHHVQLAIGKLLAEVAGEELGVFGQVGPGQSALKSR